MSSIDVSDPKYQVSPDFKPDKESTWPFLPERDGWVLAHNALRSEMANFREAFEAIQKRGEPLKAWEVTAIQTAAGGHLEHILAHHSNEDDLFVPFLKERYHYPQKLESDHVSLLKTLTDIEQKVQHLKQGDMIDSILSDWVDYEKCMLPHLKEEEDVGLPLMRAYFTPADIKPYIAKLIARSPKLEMGSIIHFDGEKFRTEFMPQEGIPSFVWYIDFQFKYATFEKVFWKNIVALKSGEEPKADSGCAFL